MTSAPEPADLVLENGFVYTVDGAGRVAQAVAIKGNRIVAVGSVDEVKPYVGASTQVRDLAGRMVMPGIHDTHIHALGTVDPDLCDFKGKGYSLEDMVPFLKDCLQRYTSAPDQPMLVVQWPNLGSNEPSERYPTLRSALDAVSQTNPIILFGYDGHHGAANSAAMARAKDAAGKVVGINRETLATVFAPWREQIAVDDKGDPTGGINESARKLVGMGFLSDLMGIGATPANLMPRVAHMLASRGITSIQDAAVVPNSLAMYRWLEDSGGMTFRVRTALFTDLDEGMTPEGLARIPAVIDGYRKLREQNQGLPYLRVDGVKLFADAVLEGNPMTDPPTLPVAAILGTFKQPIFKVDPATKSVSVAGYAELDSSDCKKVRAAPQDYVSDAAVTAFRKAHGHSPAQCAKASGVYAVTPAYLKEFTRRATDAGFNVHIHAISDAGTRAGVEAFEAAKASADRQGLTQSFAHLQLVAPEEQKRIGALHTYNAFTYAWMTADPSYNMTVVPFIEDVKGGEDGLFNPDTYYMRNVYPVKSIIDAGGIPTWGSDAPVETRDPRPFINMEVALTHSAGGRVLNESQRIDIHTAIRAFTLNGARMLGQDKDLGSIETGKIADLIVLDQNVVELAGAGRADRISDTRVLTTVFDGKVVYDLSDPVH